MQSKKVLLLAALAGGLWWLNQKYGTKENYLIETGDFSNDNGGLIKVAFNIASGDLGMIGIGNLPNSEMQISSAYLSLLKKMENGVKKGWDASKQKWFVHNDSAGYPTIAYGHLLKKGENFALGISEAEAVGLVLTDIQNRLDVVRENVKIKLSQGEFDALVDFVYNTGEGSFLGTGRTAKKLQNNIPKAINNNGNFGAGFEQMKKHYEYVVTLPKIRSSANGLLNRLRMQFNMAFNDKYSL